MLANLILINVQLKIRSVDERRAAISCGFGVIEAPDDATKRIAPDTRAKLRALVMMDLRALLAEADRQTESAETS
jgi:hypothetical protein